MSPEACQKRYSSQNRSNKTISTKRTQIISSLKSRKSSQSNELSNLPNTTIQAGIGGDKVQWKNRQRQAKTKSESRDPMMIHLNQYSSRDHQISNQKPCGGTAPLYAPIKVPAHELIARSISGVESHSSTTVTQKASHSAKPSPAKSKKRPKENHEFSNPHIPYLEIFEIQARGRACHFKSLASSEHVISRISHVSRSKPREIPNSNC